MPQRRPDQPTGPRLTRRQLLARTARIGLGAAALSVAQALLGPLPAEPAAAQLDAGGGATARSARSAPVLAPAAAARYAGRLIDAHCHLTADDPLDASGLVRLLEAASVDGCWLFAHPWSLGTDAWLAHPERIVPFLAEPYADAVADWSSYVNHEWLAWLLAGGYVRGLGEVILRHSPFRLGAAGGYASAPANHVPADDPRLIAAYRIAGRFGAPVTVHQEWWYHAELGRALEAAPETSFVWAHAGHGPPDLVGELLARYPNLHADLSARTPWIGPGTVLLGPDGALNGRWRAVLERFPERFLVGLDLFAPAHYRADYVAALSEYERGLLGQLPLDVAEQIAYRNAERLAPFALPTPDPAVGAAGPF